MSNVDIAELKMKAILADVRADMPSIESEEDAKVKIINRIFNECLGWSFTQFACENNHDSGYSDYVMKIGGQPSMVVEAKRIGVLGIESAVLDRHREFKVSGSSLKNSLPGIQQAFSYASEAGIPIAVLTDGIRWIIFKTWVQGSYKDKEAIVFPSLQAIENSFSLFYELLAYDKFSAKVYNLIFDEIHNNRENLSTPLKAAIEPEEIKILPKSPIAFDLEKIFNGFFTQLTGDQNSEIMTECFVESNESRIADYSLEKITTSILNNLPKDNNKIGSELSELIKGNVQAQLPAESDMSVFIVGPTGSGKTTYIERFFTKILPTVTRESCLTVNINSLDATGDDASTTGWITEAIIASLESSLFGEGYPEYSDLQGMYFGAYRRMASGYLKKIYENDRATFDGKFAEFLESEVKTNREGYLGNLLHFTVHNRKKLPIIIVDNTDEFTLEFKTKVFQLCNAYRRKVKYCMLMFPVTDKSAWSFSKTDIFTIHQSRSFFLPTPSPREVFRKRIDYLNRKLVTADITEKREYLTSKGIRIELKDVTRFAQVLEDVFVENNFTAKALGEITNYNIRSIMNLSKRVITSPVMRIEDLITSYVTTEPISYTKFIDALIRGDYEAYRTGTGDDFGIISIFKVNSEKVFSPLLAVRILALLRAIRTAGRDVDERHITVHSAIQYFEALGADVVHVQKCLAEMVSIRLIEPYDPSISALSDSQKLAVTYKGLAHYDLATRNSVYFYQMALTTAISDPEVSHNIRTLYRSNKPFGEITAHVRKLFSEYILNEDAKFLAAGQGREQFDCQLELLRDLKAFAVDRNGSGGAVPDNITSFLGEKLVGEVERYDPEKDYGFIHVRELAQQVYFKLCNIKADSIHSLYDSDIVYCTLGQGDKGVVVRSIEGFVKGLNDLTTELCEVKFYNSKRGYGFAIIGSTSNEAFFHKTAFPHNFHEHLKEGLRFEAEVRLKEDGKYQIRRSIGLDQ
ncbi:type I restriction endonuclease [Pseudomonas donghuensis]|uniref:type I restriction endonuclease n=1 Tax=Pseudomonas donghuensis TaxID=1163398 RepID=UPI0020C22B91|nr:type I restriction endonuclease [Pseudomonas donghuensis]MCP6697704.1 cold shock domain-containing protein [Pseudomonas donghuensis]